MEPWVHTFHVLMPVWPAGDGTVYRTVLSVNHLSSPICHHWLTGWSFGHILRGMTDIEKIEAWLTAEDVSSVALSLRAKKNPLSVDRIRKGTAHLSTLRAIMAYIRAHPAPTKPKEPSVG